MSTLGMARVSSDRFVSRIRSESCQNIHLSFPRTFQTHQINETPSACSQLSVLSDWMRHYLCAVRPIFAWSHPAPSVTEPAESLSKFVFSLSRSLGPRTDIYLKFRWQFFSYQIHFRCTDESRVIVFQYYISDSLPRANPTLSPS